MKPKVNVMWFRRDLRLHDNAALYRALKGNNPVLPVFIFDTHILSDLEEKKDARVTFIYDAIAHMQQQLEKLGSGMEVLYDTPIEAFKHLLQHYDVEKIYTNRDYEQYAIDRDKSIAALIKEHGGSFHHYKDQVIFDGNEVLKDNGEPYTVFTPYSKKWKAQLTDFHLRSYPAKKYYSHFYQHKAKKLPSLHSMGFERTEDDFPAAHVSDNLIKQYKDQRDFPGIAGTSRMGVHLRFGTVSIRELARQAMENSEVYLNELVWREFYHMILAHFEHVRKGHSFRKEYDHIKWRNNEKEFDRWCRGETGYPIVDAGMRELNTTGFMHNRVRMIVASFLAKHLLIDWRWGEAYFAKKLLDYDYAANNGGWQWAAGCGCDAAPYFRVFNPSLQTQRFDKDLQYVRKWVPEFESFNYPEPIVPHELGRNRALDEYKKALKKG
ncbi:cryptochrome/photolyase family protein [Deminuibacter soli]|uniref:Deoxyribodipyrimidine photo-lyase n=1 Tax=Deminuibacter soli TaxID=2291815 RepID=A0A3E1NCS4_9BACT|nr:deoxyribodipyrimidine photo-lyase [Deminuibacter soli]RFM25740.1 deoxyribodipyrimidine photo-lyase [Deminuibacter soli]